MNSMKELILTSVFTENFDHAEAVKWITENPVESFQLAKEASSTFLRDNWTGPPATVPSVHDELARKYLGDAEPAYHLCRSPSNLVIALKILESLTRTTSKFQYLLELVKIYWMQQNLLEESLPQLYENVQKISAIVDNDESLTAECDVRNKVEYYLIMCHIAAYYQDFAKATFLIQKAQKLAKVSSSITGILGKRTRFQEKDYAQLVVDVGNDNTVKKTGHDTDVEWRNLPHNVPLDDDTLLPVRTLAEDLPQRHLQDHEAAVLLSEGLLLHRRQAKQNLQDEEIMAFIEFILRSRPPYSIQATALFQRSKLEVDKVRKTLRAMQQLETLLTAYNSADGASFSERENLALAVNLPPFWKIQQELGYALLLNGCTRDAVNIFTSMELWEDVIECYQRVGQKVKAEDLIVKELAARPLPSMWCRLGDLREDVECYDKAWELSKHRSFRSRKDLGRLYIKRKEFTEAVKVLREGLEVNAVESGTWFLLGYALVKLKEYGSAETAFRRCISLDPDNSLAWNNLGSIALHLGNDQKAYKILRESVKTNFENWNIWDNYQNACQRVKDFDEEIHAFHRLLELRGSVNAEALALLVAAVVGGVTDLQGASATRLLAKVKTLMGAVTAKIPDNSRIWYLYGKLQAAEMTTVPGSERKEVLESVVQKLQKAYRHSVREKDWEKEESSLTNCLMIVKELTDAQTSLMEADISEEERQSIKSSLRVMLESVVIKVQRSYLNDISGELRVPEGVVKLFESIQQSLVIFKN
ncbi:tetratricopeptide repeat protein 27-like [Paramacrobiotus metropolitanus]|uniref:tetratricopeptide repeat protein 27-like n=1 Tax=Paramacrobiotus metropolitanus TaxID=2943436 RepID=UPI0024463965|nr:tetratricopeptide repeat protein 27-like [Paramacrobiotus metropolitanus]